MIDEVPSGPAREQPVTRTMLLTVLCILTFIGSGLNVISGLAIGTFFDQFVKVAADLAETYKLPGMEMITEGTPGFFFISALLYSGSVAGALMMWRLLRTGFHIYTISQILLIIAPMYFYSISGPSLPDLILTGLFVILYSMNLKLMK
jgi:hypothetical protein